MSDKSIDLLDEVAAITPDHRIVLQLQGGVAQRGKLSALLQWMLGLGSSVGLFNALSTKTIPAGTDTIQTSGWAAKGVGAATYIDATGETLAADGQNVWWVVTANARKFKLSPGEAVTPRKFGALGNGTDSDEAAIQAAVNYIQTVRGRGELCLEGLVYRCPTASIAIDPMRTAVNGGGAKLDFSARVGADIATNPELVTNGGFASSAGWVDGTLGGSSRVNWTFSGGKAVHTTTTASYGDFGRQVPMTAGKRYRCTFTVDAITSSGEQLYLAVRFLNSNDAPNPNVNGVGYGSGPDKLVTAAGTYSFDFTCPSSLPSNGLGPWLCCQTNNNVTLDDLSVREIPDNNAVLLRTLAGSPQYGSAPFTWTGVEMAGPGSGSLIDGLVLDTLVEALSGRLTAFGSDVHGFRSGLKLMNRTYTDRIFGLEAYACANAVEFVAGAEDAGENINFYGCVFYNSTVAIRNTGSAGLFFFGCSFDYCTQWFIGGGSNYFTNCWFEKQKPATLAQYPFDLVGAADIVIHGGMIQISGADFAAGPMHAYMFNTSSKFGRIKILDTAGYNWRTTTGELLGGPGRLEIEGLRGGANHNIPAVTKRDARHSLFGAGGQFEGTSIGVTAWITGGTGRTSRYGVEWRDGNNLVYGTAGLSLSTDYPRTGAKALKFSKSGVGSGTQCSWYLAAPIKPRSIANVEFWTRTPKALGGSGTAPLFVEAYFAAILGVDGDGVPILGELTYFGGKTINVDLAVGQTDWTATAFGTSYADETSPSDGYAPEWATHILVTCNPVSMPGGFELHLDDLGAWSL